MVDNGNDNLSLVWGFEWQRGIQTLEQWVKISYRALSLFDSPTQDADSTPNSEFPKRKRIMPGPKGTWDKSHAIPVVPLFSPSPQPKFLQPRSCASLSPSPDSYITHSLGSHALSWSLGFLSSSWPTAPLLLCLPISLFFLSCHPHFSLLSWVCCSASHIQSGLFYLPLDVLSPISTIKPIPSTVMENTLTM